MKPIPVIRKAIISLAKTLPALVLALLVITIVIAAPISANLWAQETETVDRIAAVINNEIITLYDLNQAFGPYANNIKSLKYPPEKERQTLSRYDRISSTSSLTACWLISKSNGTESPSVKKR